MKFIKMLACVMLIVNLGFAQEPKITRDFFGSDFWIYNPELWQEYIDLINQDSVGFGLIGSAMSWDIIEPNPPVNGVHQYKWDFFDNLIRIGVSGGKVLDMNILIRSNWATVLPASEIDETCCDMSPPKDDADSDTLQWGMTAYEAYSNFIYNLTERYDGDGIDDAPGISQSAIKFMQLGDEPDAPGHFIDNGGSPEKYNRMLELMYNAAKSANPDILIVRGKSNPGGIFDDAPDETTLKSRRSDYIDFISTNLEQGQNHFDIFAINFNDHYTGLIPFTNWLKAEMAKNGYTKDIMVGDARTSAWPRNNDGGFRIFPSRYPDGFSESISDTSNPMHLANGKLFHADEVSQSVKKILIALASGQQAISLQPAWGPVVHERMFWQDAGLLDSRVMEASKSMARARKPVYYATKQLIDALLGASSNIITHNLGDNVYAYQVSHPQKNIFALWYEDQYDTDEQEILKRGQSASLDFTSLVANSQLKVRRFVSELDLNLSPIYPQDTIVLASELVIGQTPVIVEVIENISAKDKPAIVSTYSLLQNQPNPFSQSTRINYKLDKATHIEIH